MSQRMFWEHWWPIEDASLPTEALVREGKPQLAAALKRNNLRPSRRIEWTRTAAQLTACVEVTRYALDDQGKP